MACAGQRSVFSESHVYEWVRISHTNKQNQDYERRIMKERLLSEIHGYLLNEDGLYGNKKGQRLGQRLRENTDRLQSDLGFAIERIGKCEDRLIRLNHNYFGSDLITFLYCALVVQIVGIVIFATLWVLR